MTDSTYFVLDHAITGTWSLPNAKHGSKMAKKLATKHDFRIAILFFYTLPQYTAQLQSLINIRESIKRSILREVNQLIYLLLGLPD